MKYITLDTCVWLGLIKEGLRSENNIFDEICFWIENKHLIHIVPKNLIREWNENKMTKKSQIVNDAKRLQQDNVIIKSDNDLASKYSPDRISEIIDERLDRVDKILNEHSELAEENDKIIAEAAERNLQRLAPNHIKDSFRDTLNILTLVNYILAKNYTDCVFTTINYRDFSESREKQYELHPELIELFAKANNICYIYCEEKNNLFGQKLFKIIRDKGLPSYADYLEEKAKLAKEKELQEKEVTNSTNNETLDSDYLENIKHIDNVLAKKSPTTFERKMVTDLINSHDSYKQYFLKNVGRNGMV